MADEKCWRCLGTGRREIDKDPGDDNDCPDCYGTGSIPVYGKNKALQ